VFGLLGGGRERGGVQARTMVKVAPDELVRLQSDTAQVRNICILAHVDHGKTTLSDCLVSSNGIISERLAGTVRYLDSRADEQERGITMESSAISLLYNHERLNKQYLVNLIDSPGHVDFSSDVSTAVRLCDGALILVDVVEGVAIQTHAVLRQAWEERLRPCLVLNKIDRLITDLKLDPIEAYEHLMRIIEQVNAIVFGFLTSSVMTEAAQKLDGAENGTIGDEFGLEFNDAQEEELIFDPSKGNVAFASATDSWAFRIIDFVPMVAKMLDQPNKVLLRCLWGNYFYNKKANKIVALKQTQANVTTGQSSRSKPPMFATFILQSIWQLYEATVVESRPKRLLKIITTLALEDTVNQREVKKGGKSALRAVMNAWLPVTKTILAMVVKCVPNPRSAQKRRIEILWPIDDTPSGEDDDEAVTTLREVREGIENCDPSAPMVAFVTKMFAVDKSSLPPLTLNQLAITEEEGGEFFFAFARVFSGTVKLGAPVHVLGPKYLVGHAERERHRTTVEKNIVPLLIMGTELVALESVPAGNVLAIAGLAKDVLKTATLTTAPFCCSLTKMPAQSAPILRVSLEPVNPLSWPQLADGLKLLNRADPVAEVRIQPNGEHILGAIGELHLERCVKDLRDRFAKVEIKVSQPIAIFRETLVLAESGNSTLKGSSLASPKHTFEPIDLMALERKEEEEQVENQDNNVVMCGKTRPAKRVFSGGRVLAVTSSNGVVITLRAIPLPQSIVKVLEENQEVLAKLVVANEEEAEAEGLNDQVETLQVVAEEGEEDGSDFNAVTPPIPPPTKLSHKQRRNSSSCSSPPVVSTKNQALREKEKQLFLDLEETFEKAGPEWGKGILQKVWSLGPRGIGPNLLINMIPSGQILADQRSPMLVEMIQQQLLQQQQQQMTEGMSPQEAHSTSLTEEIASGIVYGFQLACRAGPLCEEPLWGTAIVVENVSLREDNPLVLAEMKRKQATIAGEVMSTIRDRIRAAIDLHWRQHEHQIQTGCQVRLVEGFYRCLLQCHVESHQGDQLGKLYSVLSKRRAKIVSEDLWEGTSIFTIEALIPVVESFRLGDDLRRQTSGAASTPNLVFSHWQVIPENPFFRATTEEELEEFGERGYEESYLANNTAYKYLMQVRKRKGLSTNEKVVVAAEKQRTISRKK